MRNPMVVDTFYFLLGPSTPMPKALVEVQDRPAKAWCRMSEVFGSDFIMLHGEYIDFDGFTVVKLDDIIEAANVEPLALPPEINQTGENNVT